MIGTDCSASETWNFRGSEGLTRLPAHGAAYVLGRFRAGHSRMFHASQERLSGNIGEDASG
jgi:hypothetical protein